MKILILHNKVPYPPKDGGAIAVWNHAFEAAQQGHSIFLLCMNTPKHYVDPNNLPSIPNLTIATIDVNSNIKPITLVFNFLFSKKAYHLVRFTSQAFKNKLIELLQKEQFDLIIFEGLYVLQYVDIVKKHHSAFLIYRAHNVEHEIWQRIAFNEPNFFKKIYLKNLAKKIKSNEIKLIQKIDLLICLTKRDEHQLQSLGYKKLSFVSQVGIDVSNIHFDSYSITHPSIFFLGALDWIPNQEGLLWFLRHIWHDIHLLFPNLSFDVAGRNAPYWLKKTLMDYPMVQFHGEIDDASEFIKKRAVMVVPLFSGSGMRIKIIEGMAHGKSIVTTSIGAEGIPVTNNKNIIIADSIDKFKSKTIQLLQDKERCIQIGQQAHLFVKENYDIKKIVSTAFEYIEKLRK